MNENGIAGDVRFRMPAVGTDNGVVAVHSKALAVKFIDLKGTKTIGIAATLESHHDLVLKRNGSGSLILTTCCMERIYHLLLVDLHQKVLLYFHHLVMMSQRDFVCKIAFLQPGLPARLSGLAFQTESIQ